MINQVQQLEQSSLWLTKNQQNSIRYNCQRISSLIKKAWNHTENQGKKAAFLEVINKPIIYKFLKDFTN